MADLRLLARRWVPRLFGWKWVPDPTTFGCWLPRAGGVMVPVIDRLLRRLVQHRWERRGVPERLTVALDSAAFVRYGRKQAGAKVGYNPKKRGRPSHHPVLAFAVETSDLIGLLGGARLLSLEGRRLLSEAEGSLALDTHEVTDTAHVLTNIPGIQALTAWRRYNAGCVVEQRIGELAQLAVGQTAVDDLDGNRLIWDLGGLAYQLFHMLRTRLSGAWRKAQPKRLRVWLFRPPGRWTPMASTRASTCPTPSLETASSNGPWPPFEGHPARPTELLPDDGPDRTHHLHPGDA